MSALVEIRNLSKVYSFDDQILKALDNLDLVIESGEFVVVLGPSGSGKSTLLNMLGGMDVPTSGSIYLDGSLLGRKLADYRLTRVGMVFQKFNLLYDATVLENITLPLKFAGFGERDQKNKAMDLLAKVGLADRASSTPAKLSGGQQQRVAIARALVNDPSIILCDEPTGNLDSKTGEEIVNLLKQLNQQGKTIILVTHNEDYARLADHVIKLRDGQLVSDQRPKTHKESAEVSRGRIKRIKFVSLFKLASRNIDRRKMRTFLTSFGISIGAMAILVLVSFGAGLQRGIQSQLTQFGQVNQIVVQSTGNARPVFRAAVGSNAESSANFTLSGQKDLTDTTVQALSKLPGTLTAYSVNQFSGRLLLNGQAGSLSGESDAPLSQDQSAITNNLEYGHNFNSDNQEALIIPYGLAQVLGYNDPSQIIGKTLTMVLSPEGQQFKAMVVGVLNQSDVMAYQTMIPNAFAASIARQVAGAGSQTVYNSIVLVAKDSASVNGLNSNLQSQGYNTHSYADVASSVANTLTMLQVALGVIGGVAMLVAAFGIINTMMMSILERTKEIGIMKAVGARNQDIQMIFLLEAGLVGLIGGVVGLILGYPGARLGTVIFNRLILQNSGSARTIDFYIAPYLSLGVLAFSILVAVAAGFFPARRASKLDPVNSLRDE